MPSSGELVSVGIVAASILALTLGVLFVYGKAFVKISSGQALIVNKMATVEVFFTGGLVFPAVHKHEVMDVSAKSLVIERCGANGLICKDGIRADLRATFLLRVKKTSADVLRVAELVGAARAMDPATLGELFNAKFAEALESVAIRRVFADHYEQRSDFTDEVIKVLGPELNGYVLDTFTIDRLEQTPVDALDENNILDAKGILAITESTTATRTRISELRAQQQRRMKELETETRELFVELETRQSSALRRLNESTGRGVTEEELEGRLLERLRALVDVVVEARFTPKA